MKRIIFFTLLLNILGLQALHAQTQYDFLERPMCWDSLGVQLPLTGTFYWTTTRSKALEFGLFDSNNDKVVPTVGTVTLGSCTIETTGTGANFDWELDEVCWDSAGVTQDLLANYRFRQSDSTFIVTYIDVGGNPVSPTIGTVAGGESKLVLGSCLDYELINPPQECDCIYFIDQQNFSAENIENSQRILFQYEKVVTRDCGGGTEEIIRMDETQLSTIRTLNRFRNDPANGYPSLVSGQGYIDSITVHLLNPSASLVIDLNPNTVSSTYPALITAGFDPNTLIYNSTNVVALKDAWETVVGHAFLQYSADLMIPTPNYDLVADINASGVFQFGFYVTHNPNGHYAGLDLSDPNGGIAYHADNATPVGTALSGASISAVIATANHNTNCGSISTSYSSLLTPFNQSFWHTLPINPNLIAQTTLINQLGTVECTEPCPEAGPMEITIGDTINVNVVNFEDGPCDVQNKAYNDVLNNTTKVYPSNSVYSISVLLTSGSFKYRFDNEPFVEIENAGNYHFNVTSNTNCKFLQSSLTLDATEGGLVVLVQY